MAGCGLVSFGVQLLSQRKKRFWVLFKVFQFKECMRMWKIKSFQFRIKSTSGAAKIRNSCSYFKHNNYKVMKNLRNFWFLQVEIPAPAMVMMLRHLPDCMYSTMPSMFIWDKTCGFSRTASPKTSDNLSVNHRFNLSMSLSTDPAVRRWWLVFVSCSYKTALGFLSPLIIYCTTCNV